MKSTLLTSAFLLGFLIAGCGASPAATPGPAGPQGPPGQQGVSDRDRDRDRDKDREREQAREPEVAPCPAGEHERTDNGETRCVRD